MKQGQRVLLDDNGEMTAKDGDLVRWFTCMQCNEYVIAKEIYEIKMWYVLIAMGNLKLDYIKIIQLELQLDS